MTVPLSLTDRPIYRIIHEPSPHYATILQFLPSPLIPLIPFAFEDPTTPTPVFLVDLDDLGL